MRIDAVDVGKRFGGVTALEGVTLSIASGEKVALVGPNGSGKSTLTRAIMGMIRCDGELRLDGLDPFRHREALCANMAYVPQGVPQLGATVAEVTRAVSALRGLDEDRIRGVADALELDLGDVARRSVRALSGGTKQKLLIALALAAPSALLVMDEPTASLDAHARDAFFRLFAERGNGATLVLSSHRLDEVRRLVSRVIVLEGGAVALDAPLAAWEDRRRLAIDDPDQPVDCGPAVDAGQSFAARHSFDTGRSA